MDCILSIVAFEIVPTYIKCKSTHFSAFMQLPLYSFIKYLVGLYIYLIAYFCNFASI